ncbi:MAG: GDSL-type esterase/lipase family protein [Vicinamibacteria bacterium]
MPYAAFALLLAAVELSVRTAGARLDPLEAFVSASQRAQFDDARAVRIFEFDPLLFWRLRPGLHDVVWERTPVTTSGERLRYDRPLGRKRPGTFRVLCAGDSVTFGFGVPQVSQKRPDERHPDWLPYPARLERALRAENPGRAVEVAPLAVPGYSTHQGLAWMRRDLAAFQPDLVTVLYGWNDIGLRAQPDAASMKADAWSVFSRALLARSQALLRLWVALHARGGTARARAGVPRVDRDGYVANIRAMTEVVRATGAAVVVIGPVYRDRVEYPPEGDWIAERRAALRADMAGAGVPYVEVPELTEDSWPANQPLFLEHIHPNHKGHRLLAERLLAFLDDRRLLRDLRVPELP